MEIFTFKNFANTTLYLTKNLNNIFYNSQYNQYEFEHILNDFQSHFDLKSKSNFYSLYRNDKLFYKIFKDGSCFSFKKNNPKLIFGKNYVIEQFDQENIKNDDFVFQEFNDEKFSINEIIFSYENNFSIHFKKILYNDDKHFFQISIDIQSIKDSNYLKNIIQFFLKH